MNREIEFRVFDKQENKMVYFPKIVSIRDIDTGSSDLLLGCEDYISGYEYINYFLSTEYELMQYIGRKDKNGVKIYEGDIVAFIDGSSYENGYTEDYCVGKVFWDDETLSFCVTERLSAESYEVLEECEVIGTIHDKRELIDQYTYLKNIKGED